MKNINICLKYCISKIIKKNKSFYLYRKLHEDMKDILLKGILNLKELEFKKLYVNIYNLKL